jgi:ketosteroid isomerase-like protein
MMEAVMVNQFVRKLFFLSLTMLICTSVLLACAGQAAELQRPRERLSADQITQKAIKFKALADANREAHNARDIETIEALFPEDVLFVDVTFGDHLVSIDKFMSMTRRMFKYFPDFQWKTLDYFVGSDKFVTIAGFWGGNWGGNKVYSEEDPFIHVFLFEPKEEMIASWRLFYGYDFLNDNRVISETATADMKSMLMSYGSAWSSMDSEVVADIYAEDALRHDSLYDEHQNGVSEIKAFAASFFTQYPEAQWTPLVMFGEKGFSDKPQAIGSSYAIEVTDPTGEACEVMAVVLLHVLDGKIVQEDLYYNADSLIQCAWAE